MEGREGRSARHPFGPWPGVSIHFLSREMGARGGNRGRGKEGRPLSQLGPAIQSCGRVRDPGMTLGLWRGLWLSLLTPLCFASPLSGQLAFSEPILESQPFPLLIPSPASHDCTMVPGGDRGRGRPRPSRQTHSALPASPGKLGEAPAPLPFEGPRLSTGGAIPRREGLAFTWTVGRSEEPMGSGRCQGPCPVPPDSGAGR